MDEPGNLPGKGQLVRSKRPGHSHPPGKRQNLRSRHRLRHLPHRHVERDHFCQSGTYFPTLATPACCLPKKFLELFTQPDILIVVGLRIFIAVCLALAIANPACCCAFSPENQASQASGSCCPSGSQTKKDDKGGSCTCSFAKEKAAPDTDLFKPNTSSSDFILLVAPCSDDDRISSLPEAVAFLAKWPPGRLPVPPVGTRLATKCSYLI